MKRIVLFKRKKDAASADFAAALENLKTLDRRMTEMNSWWLEIIPDREGLWDACLIADFDDSDALQRYESHPEHLSAGGSVAAVADFAVFDSDR